MKPLQLEPGSFPWLLAHDVRQNWRRFAGMLGIGRPRTLVAMFAAGFMLLHLAAWPVVQWLSPLIYGADASAAILNTFVLCAFTWMIAQSLFGTTRALYDRGDLDLLLGSPLPASRVFAAKAAAITASTFGSIAILLLPLANTGILVDRAAWLAIYPVLLALALIASAIALALSIGLFFLFGARRARVVTQMIGAAIGGAFVLAAQIAAMLPAPMRATIAGWLESADPAQRSGLGTMLSQPATGLQGDGTAMASLMLIGCVLFVCVVRSLGERFARASLAAAGAAIDGNYAGAGRTRFRSGVASNLRRKEWRLLVRDPGLFAQLGLQIIYTVPIAVVLLRSETLPAALALAPTIVVVAAQVAASLAWITVSGEDAPELIASAPVTPSAVDRAKLTAVALPVLMVLAIPVIGLAILSWQSALVAAAFAMGAATSTALLNFWHPMPGNRRGMLRRHSQSKLIALVEHGLAILWATAIVLFMMGSLLWMTAVGLSIGVLAISRSRSNSGATAPLTRTDLLPRRTANA